MGNLAILRQAIPSAQVSSLTTGSITLPSARGAFAEKEYYQIATQSVSGTGTVTFSNLNTYTGYDHLEVRYFAKDNRSPVYSGLGVRFNGDTGANYWWYFPDVSTTVGSFGIYNDDASTYGYVGNIPGNSASSNYAGGWFTVFNYQDTDKWKTVQGLGGYCSAGDGSYQGFLTQYSVIWKNNAAVTSMTVFSNTASTFQSGTRISLYGIKGS